MVVVDVVVVVVVLLVVVVLCWASSCWPEARCGGLLPAKAAGVVVGGLPVVVTSCQSVEAPIGRVFRTRSLTNESPIVPEPASGQVEPKKLVAGANRKLVVAVRGCESRLAGDQVRWGALVVLVLGWGNLWLLGSHSLSPLSLVVCLVESLMSGALSLLDSLAADSLAAECRCRSKIIEGRWLADGHTWRDQAELPLVWLEESEWLLLLWSVP